MDNRNRKILLICGITCLMVGGLILLICLLAGAPYSRSRLLLAFLSMVNGTLFTVISQQRKT